MRTRSEIKEDSKRKLSNNYLAAFVAIIAYGVINWIQTLLTGGITFVEPLIVWLALELFVMAAMVMVSIGLENVFLQIASTGKAKFTDMYKPYKKNPVNKILSVVLSAIYITLWTFLFIIPGIIKAFSYALVPFIILEDNEISPNDAITKSRKMMDGHKMDLFVLYVSFYGWLLLGTLTCGILYIWLVPYMKTTIANFYLDVKEEYEAKRNIQSAVNVM